MKTSGVYSRNIDKLIRDAILMDIDREIGLMPSKDELRKMHKFSERHEQNIAVLFADMHKREKYDMRMNVLKRVAIILIAILAAIVSLRVIPTAYARIKAWISTEMGDSYIGFENSISGPNKDEVSVNVPKNLLFELNYIPDGYEIEDCLERIDGTFITYKNNDKIELEFSYLNGSFDSIVGVGIDKSLIDKRNVDGVIYYIIKDENGGITILWEYDRYLLKLHGNIEESELINIADSVYIKNK